MHTALIQMKSFTVAYIVPNFLLQVGFMSFCLTCGPYILVLLCVLQTNILTLTEHTHTHIIIFN